MHWRERFPWGLAPGVFCHPHCTPPGRHGKDRRFRLTMTAVGNILRASQLRGSHQGCSGSGQRESTFWTCGGDFLHQGGTIPSEKGFAGAAGAVPCAAKARAGSGRGGQKRLFSRASGLKAPLFASPCKNNTLGRHSGPPLGDGNALVDRSGPPLSGNNVLVDRSEPPLSGNNALERRSETPLSENNALEWHSGPPLARENALEWHSGPSGARSIRLDCLHPVAGHGNGAVPAA